MLIKQIPFSSTKVEQIIKDFPTPFHIYDELSICENAKRLNNAFSWNVGFKEYFAVKANPNPFILKILKEEGFGADCSSLPELLLAQTIGIIGENIMFSSNDTPANEFIQAKKLGAIINLDDYDHISFLEKQCGIPEVISMRYNPGKSKKGSSIMGYPEEAKFGSTKEQIIKGFELLKSKGCKRFGLHTFLASNELNPQYFIDTASMLFELAIEIKQVLNIQIGFINLSGGIGIPYKLEDKQVNLDLISLGIKQKYNELIIPAGLDPLSIFMESGRMITGPYGYLISKVLHIKKTYKSFVGLDSCMADLMRPALYNAYHHITVLNKENMPCEYEYDVTGSLCESNDKFAINRKLPLIEVGDYVIIHDTGAHGHAMGFNYNGKLRSAELLHCTNGDVIQIRRAETYFDYIATIDLTELDKFKV